MNNYTTACDWKIKKSGFCNTPKRSIFLENSTRLHPCSELDACPSIGNVWTAVLILLIEHELRGKVVWVTGASSGIGEELTYQLAKLGALLAISARREDELQRVKKKCLRKYNLALHASSSTLAGLELPQEHKPTYHNNKFNGGSQLYTELLSSFCEWGAFV